jgi:pyruvyltransferase
MRRYPEPTDLSRGNKFMSNFINGYWWLGCNYGDMLTPYLLEKLSGKKVLWSYPSPRCTPVAATGSILSQNDIAFCSVWGCGVESFNVAPHVPKEVFAVRGRLSKQYIVSSGGYCPDVFGDPALLLPLIYKPKIKRKYKFGIVPHWTDTQKVVDECGDNPDVLIIPMTDGVEKVIDSICSCDQILSSSLHGLITADAYQIPNKWVLFGNSVPGKGFKFKDYWSGVYVEPSDPIDMRNKISIESLPSFGWTPIHFKPEKLLDACPFPMVPTSHILKSQEFPSTMLKSALNTMLGAACKSGSCIAFHIPILYTLSLHTNGPAVELGAGCSTVALLAGCLENDTKLITYDKNPASKTRVFTSSELSEKDPIWDSWSHVVEDSVKAAKLWKDNEVSLLFVDACHSYEAVQNDLNAWFPKMRKDGIICGHDYYLPGAPYGVKPAVDEFAKKYENQYSLQVFKKDNGFFILWPKEG